MTAANRKDEHVALALSQRGDQPALTDFDRIRFVHDALAGGSVAAADAATVIGGLELSTPFYINGMTGGSANTGDINRKLAIAARETGTAVATGSLSVYFKDPSVAPSYRVMREENPEGLVFANVNATMTADQAQAGVELLEANALQIHINAAQEIVMPEGDRDFSGWAQRIEEIVARVEVPVIVKEVGFGITADVAARLFGLGVAAVDVSGNGGTNFARIENARRVGEDFAYLGSWGQSTVECLLDCQDLIADGADIVASGGVRNPLDVVRALALGARGVAVAGTFLKTAVSDGEQGLIDQIRRWQEHTTSIMALLGADRLSDLTKCPLVLDSALLDFCAQRGIDPSALSARAQGR